MNRTRVAPKKEVATLGDWSDVISRLPHEKQCVAAFSIVSFSDGMLVNTVVCCATHRNARLKVGSDSDGKYLYCPESNKILIYDRDYKH